MKEPIIDRRRRVRGSKVSKDSAKFAARRESTIDRLVRAGLPRAMAQGWIEAWDESTAELPDFRNAPDFWVVGYKFAQEEYERSQLSPATTH
jgi:hypothetical protein